MNFSSFLLHGPSMNTGLYDCRSYIPKDPDAFKQNILSLNTAAINLPPKNFDTSKVIKTWTTFTKTAESLTNSLYIIPFAIAPIIFSAAFVGAAVTITAAIAGTAVIITATALAALGFYRSYQAGVQKKAWPGVSSMINQTEQTLLLLTIKQEFEKCAEYLTSLNRHNANDFIAAFFDEEKNPLVRVQSQKVVVSGTDTVFDFYPALKADYDNFTKQTPDSLTAEQMAQNIENFIKAYIAKDAAELKKCIS